MEGQKKICFFLISQCITLFGSTLVQMAVIWYVTLQTDSGIWVAAFSVCSYLPQFVISFVGGVWADRYSRKRLILAADTVTALVTMLVFGMLGVWNEEMKVRSMLLVMAVLRSLCAGIQTPAVSALLPQLVPREHYMRWNGIYAAMQSVVNFAAPAAAGAILAVLPFRSTLLVDVCTAVIGIGIFSVISVPAAAAGKKSSVREEMKAGLQYCREDRKVGKLVMLYGVFVFLCVPAGFLAGLLVSRVYGDTYWYLTAVELAGFGGMTAGGLLMSLWGGWKDRYRTLSAGLALFGAMEVGMGLAPSFPWYLVMMGFYGVALTMVQTTVTVLLQEQVRARMQGRVFGLLNSAYSGFLPLGMAVFGPMADLVPLQGIMAGSGVLLFLLAACVFPGRQHRKRW